MQGDAASLHPPQVFVQIEIQSTPLNRVTSGPGYLDPIKRRNILTEYCRSVTIVTKSQRGFLNHQKHISIVKHRVFSHFSGKKMSQILSGSVRSTDGSIKRSILYMPQVAHDRDTHASSNTSP